MRDNLSLLLIFSCLPFIMWGVCGILPTFDDFTTLQSPWYIQIADPGYFPPDAVRRPFDFLFGCLLGWCPSFFPTLNHIVILLGHTANAILVFALCRRLKLNIIATNIATLFFFFSPATLGATLACDGLNQTFAQFWGLMALWIYLKNEKGKTLWLLFVIMSALSKENGLAWAIVPPIVAFAFGLNTHVQAIKDIGKGLLLAVCYLGLLFGLIHSGILGIDYPDEYADATLMNHLKDFVQLMAYTWVPIDYMSAVYPPTRNWIIVAVTVLMALPFITLLVLRCKHVKWRCVLLLVLCFFILVSPHIITVVSMMHNYAALSITALIIATILSSREDYSKIPTTTINNSKIITWTFVVFIAAAIFTDVHHYLVARQSGFLGKQLALQAINQADKPIEKAFVINIDNPAEPQYSSFCVRPVDAFGWGLSVRHYSDYTWQTAISEVTLTYYDNQNIQELADSALHAGNDVVWVAGHRSDSILVITAQNVSQ